jgi:predicted phage terminase large subunit-like protein
MDLEHYLSLLEYELALQEAEDDLLRFAEVTMPEMRFPDDISRTRYKAGKHHRLMADLMMQLERGELRKLIINTAPRHGKSELCTKRFCAWYSALHPDHDIIVATYNEKFALDFGKDIREIIDSPRFKQIFPEYYLKSASNETVTTYAGGDIFFLGRRSSTTGRGANCFPPGTMVETHVGPVAIEKIFASPSAYRLVTLVHGGITQKSVTAASSRQADGLRRITFASGRVAYATGEHPYLTGRGWLRARDVAPGDRVLRLMRPGYSSDGVRDAQVRGARAGEPLLLSEVLGAWGERPSLRPEALRCLRSEYPEVRLARRGEGASLLQRVLERTAARQSRGFARVADGRLPDLPEGVSFPAAWRQAQGLLLARVRRHSALSAHVGQGKPEVEAWRDGAPAEALAQLIPHDASDGAGAGRPRLRSVQGIRDQARSASHGQRPHEQLAGELGDFVLAASSPVARSDGPEAAYDTVAVVEVLRGEQTVYDLEVAESHNFFADGLLVSNCIIVDDPTKDDKDVRYDGFREDVWQWFTQTLLTRRHDDKAIICISQTRWHEDDIVGRITDKQNPAYSPKFADGFTVVNLPAIAEHDDPLKRKPGEPLWPERFGLKYLEEMQDANPASFAALYQCDPTPDDGVFFRVEEIHEYEAGELPEKLTMYVASDHAVGTKNINDPSCLVPFGLDENGTAWVMPQIVWRRMDAQEAVEEMIGIMRNQKPVFWYAEKGHITKSIGPFLSKRMEEEGVYTPVLEEQPIGDKIQRAQSGRARCAQGKIKFPKHAPWWPRAKAELLKFPNARFDDFVDVVSMIGLKVGYHTGPSKVIQKPKHAPGTFGYMLAEFRKQDREDAFRSEAAGWGVSR